MKNRMISLVVSLLGCLVFSQAANAGSSSTSNVNVVNTPTVNVGNTPSVSVANTPSVNVANTPIIQDRDNPARQPFQATFQANSFDLNSLLFTIAAVPGGKRLVIEHVSVFCMVPTGQKLDTAYIGTTLQNNNYATHYLTLTAQGTDGDFDYFAASQGVHLYADPGTNVTGYVQRNAYGGGNPFLTCTVSGYLVNVP